MLSYNIVNYFTCHDLSGDNSIIALSHSGSVVARYVASQIDFDVEGAEFCGGAWVSETRKREVRKRCPVCSDFGDGEGKIGNQRRFFHERNRSCYIGVVQPKQKHNPTVKCAKCGESGTEHHGRDGYIRVRHADRVCYIGRTPIL